MEIQISEKLHYKRLNLKNIVIEEIYKHDDKKEKVLVRSTDGLRNDTIINCKKIEKRYFYNNKGIYIEKEFDKDATYSYYFGSKDESEITCPNCGYYGKKVDFFDGCPYCGTNFNIDYDIKGARFSDSFKEIINTKWYKVVVLILSLIGLIVLNIITKNHIVTALLSLIYFFIFLVLSHLILTVLLIPYIILHISKGGKKNTIIDKIKNIDDGIKPTKLLNDLNFVLNNYYYNGEKNPKYTNLIDFDIIKYDNVVLSEDKNSVIIQYVIRKIYFIDNKISKELNTSKIKLRKNKINDLIQSGYTVIECKNCGASIDITSKECEYCKTPTNYKNEWEIDEIIND